VPEEWAVFQVAKAFGLAPSEARRELYELNAWPSVPLMLELESYARAKAAVDGAKKASDVPRTPLTDRVMETQARIFAEDKGLGFGKKAERKRKKAPTPDR
jgi:hypothetical protein